jgi:aryl-alcohol dehydrogenase-like predicted oxidoreductase
MLKNEHLLRKISLGSAQFGLDYGVTNHAGKVSPVEVKKILSLAESHGISMIDTASMYGTSESTLGAYDLNNFEIITKFLRTSEVIDNYDLFIRKTLGNSFERLRVNSIYGRRD